MQPKNEVDEIRGLSRAIEPAVLTAAVDAICALKDHDADAVERVMRFEETAFERGALDLLVTAYRSIAGTAGRLAARAVGDAIGLSRLVRTCW